MAYLLQGNLQWHDHEIRVLRIIGDESAVDEVRAGTRELIESLAEPITEAQAPANLEQARAAGLAPTPSTDPEMARAAAQAAPPPAQNDAMLAVLAQLAEGQQQMAASLDKLADKVKAPPRRKTTRKKATAKKAPAGSSDAAA